MRGCTRLLMLVLALAACEGPEGPVGPVGPQGVQGVKGPQGEQGDPARIQTQSITLFSADFSASGSVQEATYAAPLITEQVFEEGAVLAYWRTEAEPVWTAMPLVLYPNGADVTLGFSIQVGLFRVRISTTDTELDAPSIFEGDQVRFVAVSELGKNSPDYRRMSYDELIRHLDIVRVVLTRTG